MQASDKAPATIVLGTLWVVVFVALCVVQRHVAIFYPLGGSIPILPATSHRFGDLTPRALVGGQLWRAVTATFVHYSLLHLVLNLIGLIQLGRMVEAWYGSGPLLGIYLVIGGLGNLAAGLVGWSSGRGDVHTGGGSTVVFGLVALVAVVGWRSHSEFGVNVWLRMLALLLLSGLLGLLLPHIDNVGHAAGTLCGAAVGLADAALIRRAERPGRTWAGPLGALILAACALGQFREDRAERARAAARGPVVRELIRLRNLYTLRAQAGPDPSVVLLPRRPNPLGVPPLVLPADRRLADSLRAALAQDLRKLEALAGDLATGNTAAAFRRWKILAARAWLKRPTPEERREFDALFARLLARAAGRVAVTGPSAIRSARAH
jgi:rhomboid protease GluP